MTTKNKSAAHRHKLTAIAVALGALLFLAINVFSNNSFRALQVDLTEGSLYTLSDGTRKVLEKVDEPITARLYFSGILGEQSPPHARYYERVRELLEQYSNLTEGRFRLQVFNPEPFSDDEDSAVSYGLTGIPLNESGDLGYFGLAASNSTDDNETVAFFTPEREAFLEYDLTKLVLALASPKKTVVGVLSTLPINGGFLPGAGQRPRWSVIEQINEFFEVQPVAPDVPVIDDDVSILMVVHPKALPKKTQYAIDQFVMRGGKVLAFVDPAAEVDKPPRGQQPPGRSDLADILKTWGLELRQGRVAGDLDTARRVNVRVGAQVAIADYVGWLTLRTGNFDRDDAAMADLQMINMGTAGILDVVKDAGTQMTPLIRTGMRSMAIDAARFAGQPDVIGMFRNFKAGSEPLTLAARVTGPVKTAFPDGPPDDKDGKLKPKHLAQSKSDLQAIVIADVDMLHDQLWADVQDLLGKRMVVPFANNTDFIINALENLSGGASLNELRGRTISSRPFHLVREIRQAAERRFRAKEEELQKELDTVRGELNKLIRRENIQSGELILKPEDRAKIDNARTQMVAIRKELRGVQHELRKDIDTLDSWLKFFNIAAIPLLLGLGTLLFVLVRRLRRSGGVVETS
ncbi:MAG: GldG family protein [Rhodospirillaceae bacterium]|nr:GldG family protein [Rhodospirillaceae bacterium]